MSTREDRDFLEDMLKRIQLTEEFVKDGEKSFQESRLIQEAVIRNLEVIGEATRHLSEELRNSYSDIPWRQIAAFRNFVIHTYWNVSLERVWQVVKDELPELKNQITDILNESAENDFDEE